MKAHSLIFSAPMMRAIREDRKTQTRRIVKPMRGFERYNICRPDMAADPWAVWWHGDITDHVGVLQEAPHGKPGDLIWCREAWRTREKLDKYNAKEIREKCREAGFIAPLYCPMKYEADGEILDWGDNDQEDFGDWGRYRSSIFMPRWASCETLRVLSVRPERVQDINYDDCEAEGVQRFEARGCSRWWENCLDETRYTCPVEAYSYLWDAINAKRGHPWDSNPWVWRYEFERVK